MIICFINTQIAELSELDYIEKLPILRVVNLLRNPIQVRDDLCQEREMKTNLVFFPSLRSSFDDNKNKGTACLPSKQNSMFTCFAG